jgi:hypothetical protein
MRELASAPYMAPGASLSNIPDGFVGKVLLPSEGIETDAYSWETATTLNDDETVSRMSVGLDGEVTDLDGNQAPLIAKNQTIWGGTISLFSRLGKVFEENGGAFIEIAVIGKKIMLKS